MEFINHPVELSGADAVSGMTCTVEALNERRVKRLIVCATLMPSAGSQCDDCLILDVGVDAQPERCLYCGSIKLRSVDVRTAMIARAYRLGCTIEIRSWCPELERAGGVGALLDDSCSRKSGERPPADRCQNNEVLVGS